MKVMKNTAGLLAAAWLGSVAAWAVPITITDGNPGGGDLENVLFNDPTLPGSGTLVQGNFSPDPGFVVNFTSTSGSGNLIGEGGQARIEGGTGNDPFTNLSFWIDDWTFTRAVINPNATTDGEIRFTVSYIDAAGSPHVEQRELRGSGQNFFGIDADDGARITRIEIDALSSAFEDVRQIRLGGFQPIREDPTRVPDGGSTAALLGLGFLGLAALARRRR